MMHYHIPLDSQEWNLEGGSLVPLPLAQLYSIPMPMVLQRCHRHSHLF